MAYSTQRAVSDGTMVYLDIAIGYQSRNDIKVFFDDLPAPDEAWDWVGTTDKRIAFTPAVPNGVEVLVQRTTRLDRIINKFALGAKFNNNTMDMNFEQVLFLTQEAIEGSALSDIYNDVDFHGYKIKNLGVAVDANDAITYGQVQGMSTGAYQAQLAAEAARDLAQKWASQLTTTVDGTSYSAKQYALNASTSATNSANSASASQTSATNSANSAAASQTSRLAAEAARDQTFVARDEALGAAAPATEIYDRLDVLDAHAANTSNPHATTKAQVGLSNVDNTSDASKPVSTAQQTALNTKMDKSGGQFTSTIAFGNIGDFSNYVSGAFRVRQYATNWYWAWNGADGSLAWVANGANRFSIDPNGNLNTQNVSTSQTITGGYITSTGNVNANGALTSSGGVGLYTYGNYGHQHQGQGFALDCTSYAGDSSYWSTNVIHANGNWGDMWLYASHQPGQWAGWRFVFGGGAEHQFRTSGDAYNANGWKTFSDRRLKTDIARIENALDKLDLVDGYTFYKPSTWQEDFPDSKKRQGGGIAQEWEAAMPESVSRNGDYLAVEPLAQIGFLTAALKELKAEVLALKAQLNKEV